MISSIHGAFEDIELGARPLSMGSAYVAVADDSNAIFWNPGGLPQIKNPELNISYMELYDLVSYSSVGYVQPTKIAVAGLGLVSSSDVDGIYQEIIINLSAGKEIYKNLNLGSCLKYLYSSANLGNEKIGSGKGFSLDIGMQYLIHKDMVRIGAALKNPIGYVAYNRKDIKGIPGEKYHERPGFSYKAGVSLNLGYVFPKIDKTLINAELSDNDIHIGLEYTFRNILAIRAGFRTGNALTKAVTMGFGLNLQSVRLDYGYVGSQVGAQTSQFSISTAW